jgi:hypothetical protein
MYPSGGWRGYWEQAGYGRQLMEDFTLWFAQGKVEGSGRDCIGAFTFTGSYDDQGLVVMTKQYIGRHRVNYHGSYDGEGTIFGTWSIPPVWSGPFALTPAQRQPAGEQPLEDL